MQTVKKLLVTFFVMMLFLSGYQTVAWAEENTAVLSTQEAVTEEPDHTDATSEPVEDIIEVDLVDEQLSKDDDEEEENEEIEKVDKVSEEAKTTSDKKTTNTSTKTKTSTKDTKTTTTKTTAKTTTKKEAVKATYSKKDLRLLACLIYTEAGNQSYNGMVAVGNVVLNRIKSASYGHVDTVSEVIYDKKWAVQFAVTVKSKKSGQSTLDKALSLYDSRNFGGANPEAQEKSMNKAIKAAKAALEGENVIGDYLCFQNKRSASRIKKKYPSYKIIGDHIFYRTK